MSTTFRAYGKTSLLSFRGVAEESILRRNALLSRLSETQALSVLRGFGNCAMDRINPILQLPDYTITKFPSEGYLDPKLNLARRVSLYKRERRFQVLNAVWLHAMQSGVRSGQQVKRLTVGHRPGRSKAVHIKHIVDLVEVGPIENVGAFHDKVHSDSAVAVEEYSLGESHVSRGIGSTTVVVTARAERDGEVVV